MFESQNKQIDEWKQQLKAYEKNKRTKRPHGKSLPKIQFVTYRDMKQKQSQYNPILQTYRDPRRDQEDYAKTKEIQNQSLLKHMNKEKKYSLPYDIVNLVGSQQYTQKKKLDANKKLGPVRNIYNVINNQILPNPYLDGRDVRLSLQRPRHLVKSELEDYDVINGNYRSNNENKIKENEEQMKKSAWRQFEQGRRGLDHLSGKFYDPNIEEHEYRIQQQRVKLQKQRKQKNMPHSYLHKQSVMFNQPEELPRIYQTIDERRDLSKKRYKMKHLLEDQYKYRNLEDEEKIYRTIKNHVHDGRIWEEKSKQYDIINSRNNYAHDRADRLFGRTPSHSTWDKMNLQPKIKSRGFD